MNAGTHRIGLTAVLSILVLLLSACASEVGDIDRTDPDKVRKTDLKGIWYYAITVIEAPVPSPLTFDGEQSYFPGPTKVVFDIQEDYLVVYPTTELYVKGSEKEWHKKQIRNYWDEGKSDEFVEMYVGQPIGAFKIEKHFDVIRKYNAQTGEQSNVIVEDTADRKWFEREYIRVNWAKNSVKDLFFLASAKATPVDYYVPEYEEDNPDAFEMTENSLNFVTKLFVEPAGPSACDIYMVSPSDCVGVVAKIRHSFLKADPNNDYVPLFYDQGKRMDKFGFFLAERYGYDQDNGLVYWAKEYLIGRWNIWTNSRTADPILDADGAQVTCRADADCEGLHDGMTHCWLEDGWFSSGHCVTWDPTPVHERGVKPIRYWISPNWPDDYKESCYETADQWNEPFKDTVAWSQMYSEKGLYDVRYCDSNADCVPEGVLLDSEYPDRHPRYCDPATNDALPLNSPASCKFGVAAPEKDYAACTAQGICTVPRMCSANAPCVQGQMCFNYFCHECAREDGNCSPDLPADWAKVGTPITDRGAFTLYYLQEPDSTGETVRHFRRGVDEDRPNLAKGDVWVQFAHLNFNVGKVRLTATAVKPESQDIGSVCTIDAQTDAQYSYMGDALFNTPGCVLSLLPEGETDYVPPVWNFEVYTVDGNKLVAAFKYVTLKDRSVHTFALVGNGEQSRLIHGETNREEVEYGGMRLAHGVVGGEALDFSVLAARTGENVTFGQFTRHGYLAEEGSRVVALPAGAGSDITCYHYNGVGMCSGWRKELSDADLARVEEIKDSIPDMFVACENIYTGDLCSEDDRGNKALMNDCRYWYEDANGEWRNPCGETDGAYQLKKHGDIRFSQMYWVSEDQSSSPLGYGPNALDPDTGEVIYGIANIYGAPMIGYGNYAKDLLDLATGKLDSGDVMSGKYIREYLANKKLKEETGSLYAPLPDPERQQRLRQVRPPVERFWLTPDEENRVLEKLRTPEIQRRILDPDAAKEHLVKSLSPSMSSEQLMARFNRVQGSWLEDLLVTEEVKLIGKGSLNGSELSADELASLSPVNWLAPPATDKYKNRLAKLAAHNYYAQEMVEPNIFATAVKVQEWCSVAANRERVGKDEEECQVWRITKLMLDGVLEHEVGHTVGLRHNFSASKDIFNFQDEYYSIREPDYRTCTLEGSWGCPHGDECRVRCTDDKDCMPGTTCEEVTVEVEDGAGVETTMACVNQHLDVTGWCWGVREEYVDCTSDADCEGLGAVVRCSKRPVERWGRCQVAAAPDGQGLCPAGSVSSQGMCVREDLCLVTKGEAAGRCQLDGSRACQDPATLGYDECMVVWQDHLTVPAEPQPIQSFMPRSYMRQSEIEAGRGEYQYSSLMDYGGTVNFDINGIGKYDQAAIRFGYGELIDVYVDYGRLYTEMEDVAELWGNKYYWSINFMDTSIFNDFYWYSPFLFLTDFVGVKENLERVPVPYRKADLEVEMLASNDRGMYDATYRLVPYEMSTDMWRGSLETYVWDLGADLGEIIDHSWNKLHEYYIFDAFKRERWAAYRGANPLSYYNRIYARWFPPLEDAGRFYALFKDSWRGYPDLQKVMFASPVFMGRWKIFAEDGLQKLAQLIFSPAPGSYQLVDAGTPYERYVNFSYDIGEPGSELDVPVGDGKFPYTTFYDGAGYYYYEHAAFIGSFWEKLAALNTLTYALGEFMGDYMGEQVSVGVGSSVGYNNNYYTEITNMLTGFIVGDRSQFAPYVENGALHFFDPLHPWESAGMPKVETGVESLAMRGYHALLGYAFVPSGFNTGIVDSLRLCLKGNGNCYDVATDTPDTVDPIDVVEYTDPWTKKTYVARSTNYDSRRIDASFDLLVRANELKEQWEAIGEDEELEAQRLTKELARVRETLDMLLTFDELYGLMQY